MGAEARVRDAFLAACLAELVAPKPGNVHVFADGHRMRVADFEASAHAAAPHIAAPGASIGERVLAAMRATHTAVGTNTNLGILLLAAPLALAAERMDGAGPEPLHAALGPVLDAATVADSRAVAEAIRLASPAGLGTVKEGDVSGLPDLPLKALMALAESRDSIARQYVTTFADVFDLGLDRYREALGCGLPPHLVTACVYGGYASRLPDSHVARKFGSVRAEEIRRKFADYIDMEAPGDMEAFARFDTWLKGEGINPGTSADLTVATLFVVNLAIHL